MKLKLPSLFIFVTSVGLCLAQDAAKKKDFDPKGEKIMNDTVAFLKGLDSLQVDTAFSVTISSDNPAFGGEDVKQILEQKFNLNGRDQFSLTTVGEAAGMGAADAYFNNGVGTVVVGGEGAIEVKDIENLEAFFQNEKLGYQKEAEMNPFLDQNLAVATLKSLMLHKADEAWDENITRIAYGGADEVGGIKAHRLEVQAEQNIMGQTKAMDMELWIADGDQPTLLKVIPDMNAFLKAMAAEGGGNPMLADMKMEVAGSFKNWKINEPVGEDLFKVELADIERYDSFMDMMKAMMGGGGPGGGEDPAEQLVGQPAADFDLELLNGDSFKLSDQKGEKVVILDFWATWCGPCVRALPELMAAAEDFKGKDVVLVAVNQREKTSRIQKFLDKQGWKNLTVALDVDGAVGDQFGVQGIPQTVIVGKDGLVKKVHVGFAPGLKDQISKELNEILGGE